MKYSPEINSIDNKTESSENLRRWVKEDLTNLSNEIFKSDEDKKIDKFREITTDYAIQILSKFNKNNETWSFENLTNPEVVRVTLCLQIIFNGTKYDSGIIDGIFGPKTQKKLQVF